MKKVLLATTALGLFAAGSAFAQSPKVTIGGHADFQVGVVDQDGDYENGGARPYDRDLHTQTDTELHIKIDGQSDNGLKYGAHIELEADVNNDDNTGANNNNAEKGFIYVESNFGRVEVGPNTSVNEALRVNAGNFARATGGINGDFYEYVDLDGAGGANGTAGTTDTFVTRAELPTAAFPGNVGANTAGAANHEALATANKINYYTPRFSGFQAGVSYTPDLTERGTSAGFSSETTGAGATNIEDIWNLGVNYEGTIQNVGITAAIVAEFGDHEATTQDDLEAYEFGLTANFRNFTVGGSYAHLDEFGQAKANGTEAEYWTLGAAYEHGPFAVSVTYLNSEVENDGATNAPDREFDNLSFGADYQLAPGLVPYVEVSFFDADDNNANDIDNDGSVVIFGTTLSF